MYMYIDMNAISYLDLNIFQQDEYFCPMEVENIQSPI